MRIYQRLVYAGIFALLIFFLSLAVDIIPCQIAPSVPNPSYKWQFCTLNPDINLESVLQKKFFGYTTSLTEAYLLVIVLSFLVAFILLTLVVRSRKE